MVPMKLDIVYMDTISLVNFTAQVYEKCIVVQFIRDWRLKTCLAAKCILRGPGKREIRNPVFCTTREGEGGKGRSMYLFPPHGHKF
jgi:hypothetical protein